MTVVNDQETSLTSTVSAKHVPVLTTGVFTRPPPGSKRRWATDVSEEHGTHGVDVLPLLVSRTGQPNSAPVHPLPGFREGPRTGPRSEATSSRRHVQSRPRVRRPLPAPPRTSRKKKGGSGTEVTLKTTVITSRHPSLTAALPGPSLLSTVGVEVPPEPGSDRRVHFDPHHARPERLIRRRVSEGEPVTGYPVARCVAGVRS